MLRAFNNLRLKETSDKRMSTFETYTSNAKISTFSILSTSNHRKVNTQAVASKASNTRKLTRRGADKESNAGV